MACRKSWEESGVTHVEAGGGVCPWGSCPAPFVGIRPADLLSSHSRPPLSGRPRLRPRTRCGCTSSTWGRGHRLCSIHIEHGGPLVSGHHRADGPVLKVSRHQHRGPTEVDADGPAPRATAIAALATALTWWSPPTTRTRCGATSSMYGGGSDPVRGACGIVLADAWWAVPLADTPEAATSDRGLYTL